MAKKLRPTSEAEQALAQSPAGMRELLRQHQLHNPLVRTVLRTTECLSELDAMTVLAFHAVCSMEDAQQAQVDHLMRCSARTVRQGQDG
jgi:hypothetical protein